MFDVFNYVITIHFIHAIPSCVIVI